jgi:two-component system, chemotaxis family, chemotaxis protein CheY
MDENDAKANNPVKPDLTIRIYIIRWAKDSDKPDYHIGEFVALGENEYIPAPPQVFWNLNALMLYMKNRYSGTKVALLVMGFSTEESELIEKFAQAHPFVFKYKFVGRPSGKKPDGTPYRIFLVDDDNTRLRELNKILLDEHFEIISMARTPDNSIAFFCSYARHIDILITEIHLNLSNMFEAIRMMKKLKPDLKVIVLAQSPNKIELQRLMDMKVDRILIKPVDRKQIIEALKQITRDVS